jgi:polyisoprenyl-teichoic acid--peptidoglycan teichoic acid transferase
MHRKPRRIHSHPQYARGTRLNAGEVRNARRGNANPGVAASVVNPAGRPSIQPSARRPLPIPVAANRRWGGKRLALVGIPLILLLVSGVLLLPVIWKAHQAADKIFVPPPPKYDIVPNAQGTPEIKIRPTDQQQTGADIKSWNGKDRVNILLLGVDDRQDGIVPRSDTMIVVSIDPVAKTVGMVSIPRDLLVTIPGHGDDKINAAYPYGSDQPITGPGLAKATVEYNFHIKINYYAEVNFTGFTDIVNTLGGVTLDVAAPIKDDEYPGALNNYTRVLFHTGLQHMDGKTALQYARTRHDDNDFARGDRQQQVLTALRQQGTQLGLISKAPSLISELGDTVRTDLSLSQTLSLAKLATQIDSGNIKSYSLLPALTESSTAAGYYLIPDWSAINGIMSQALGGSAANASSGQSTAVTPTPAPPDLGAAILVQNATQINGLASNSSNMLTAQGFTSVTVAQASGSRASTEIVDYSGNLATANRIATVLGLPASIIKEGDSQDAGNYAIVVTLGSDAPIPTP